MAWTRRTWLATWWGLAKRPGMAGHLGALGPIWALALLVRAAVLVLHPQPVAHDALTYDALAVHLVSGRGYVLEPGAPPTAVRGPAYPLFLAGIYALFGHSYPAVFAAQTLVDLGAMALTYAMAWGLYRRREVALLAALGYACYLPFALQVGQVMTETLFTLFILLGIWCFLRALEAKRQGQGLASQAAAGAALGLAALTRPAALLIPWVLAFSLLWLGRGWRRSPWGRQALGHAGALLAAFVLVLVPWAWRNWQVFHAFVPTSTLGGVNLYLTHYALDQDDYLTAPSAEETRRMLILTRALERERAPLDEAELDRVFLQKALALIRQHPLRYLRLCLNRFFQLWFNLGYPGGTPSVASWLLACTNGVVLALVAVGLWAGRSTTPRPAWVLVGVLTAFTLFHVAVLAYARFIFPVMPLALVLAAEGLVLLAEKVRRTSKGASHLEEGG